MLASRLSAMLLATPDVLPGMSQTDRNDRVKHRTGTVHRSQGMEAKAVTPILGTGRGAKAGSRRWAGTTTNLLNVAGSRAKRVFNIVGTRTKWQSAGIRWRSGGTGH
jgi:hypothetical protein